MGTTSEKLTYLNTTKSLLKDSINITEANITNETTFREYPNKLKDGLVYIINNGTEELYDNFPKIISQGENITLNNTYNAPIKIQPLGNTKQNTLTGKNKLGLTDGDYSANSVTIQVSNGVITINGTPSENTNIYIPLLKPITLPVNQSNTLTINTSGNTYSQIANRITINQSASAEGSFAGTYLTIATGTKTKSYTQTETQTFNYYFLRVNTGNTYDVTITSSQLETGLESTSYEQYCGGTSSPNPDFPQPVNVVSGDNSIMVCGKNLFSTDMLGAWNKRNNNLNIEINDKNKITLSSSDTGTFGYSYTAVAKYPANIGRTYTISYTVTKTNTGTPDDNFINLSATELIPDNTYQGTKTVTATQNYIWVYVALGKQSGTAPSVILDNIIINNGDTAITFEPYVGDTYPVNLPVENLFDKDNANVLDGYLADNGNFTTNSNFKTLYISSKPNTTYTISKKAGLIFRVAEYETIPTLGTTYSNRIKADTGTSITYTTSNIGHYIVVNFWRDTDTITEQQMLDNIQIELGSKANQYWAYGTPALEMCEIDTYKDYFYKDSDKWYLHKEIGKVVLNGSEEWIINSSGTASYSYRAFITGDIVVSNIALSNYYTRVNITNTNTIQGIEVRSATNRCEIRIRYGEEDTLANFKTWLSTHNTIVYYVLATPTNTEITDNTLLNQLNALERAKSKDGTTNIFQENNDLAFIINASALVK